MFHSGMPVATRCFHCASSCMPHFPPLFVLVSLFFNSSSLLHFNASIFCAFSAVLRFGVSILCFLCIALVRLSYFIFYLPCFFLACLLLIFFDAMLHSDVLILFFLCCASFQHSCFLFSFWASFITHIFEPCITPAVAIMIVHTPHQLCHASLSL